MKRLTLTATMLATVTAMFTLTGLAYADDHVREARPGESLTVFVDVSVLSRKKRGAEKINETHEKHYAAGWVATDVAIYTENGDLQGYFVTYVGRN